MATFVIDKNGIAKRETNFIIDENGVGKIQNTPIQPNTNKYFKQGKGNVIQNTLASIGDAGVNLAQGVWSIPQNATKTLGYIANSIDPFSTKEEKQQRATNIAGMFDEPNLLDKIENKVDQYSYFGDKSDAVGEGIGYYGGMLGLKAVGVPWQVTAGVTSFGSSYTDAINEGASTRQAVIYGLSGSIAEIATEYMFGGIKLPGTGKTTDKLFESLTDKIKNEFTRKMVKWMGGSLGEGIEEVVSGASQTLAKRLIYDYHIEDSAAKNLFGALGDYNKNQFLDDLVPGVIVAGITGGAQNLMSRTQQSNTTTQENTPSVQKDNITKDTETVDKVKEIKSSIKQLDEYKKNKDYSVYSSDEEIATEKKYLKEQLKTAEKQVQTDNIKNEAREDYLKENQSKEYYQKELDKISKDLDVIENEEMNKDFSRMSQDEISDTADKLLANKVKASQQIKVQELSEKYQKAIKDKAFDNIKSFSTDVKSLDGLTYISEAQKNDVMKLINDAKELKNKAPKVEKTETKINQQEEQNKTERLDTPSEQQSKQEETLKKEEPKQEKGPKEFVPSEKLKKQYNELTSYEKAKADKIIELRARLKANPKDLVSKAALENITKEGLSAKINKYVSAYNIELSKFNIDNPDAAKKVEEPKKQEEKETVKKVEEPKKQSEADKKVSKYAKKLGQSTVFESAFTKEQVKEFNSELATYQKRTVTDAENKAKNKLEKMGYEKAVEYFNNQKLSMKAQFILADADLAKATMMEAIKRGDYATAKYLAFETSILYSISGQTIENANMYEPHNVEEAKFKMEMTAEKLRQSNIKGAESIKLTEAQKNLLDKCNVNGEFDIQRFALASDSILKQWAKKLPTNLYHKSQSIRYFQMLSSLRTHARNIAANVLHSNGAMNAKDVFGTVVEKTLEKFAPDMVRNTADMRTEVEVYGKDSKEITNARNSISKNNISDVLKNNPKELNKIAKDIMSLKGEVKYELQQEFSGNIQHEMDTLSNNMQEWQEEIDKIQQKENPSEKELQKMYSDKEQLKEMEKDYTLMQNIKEDIINNMPRGYRMHYIGKISTFAKTISQQLWNQNEHNFEHKNKYTTDEGINQLRKDFGESLADSDVTDIFKNDRMSNAQKREALKKKIISKMELNNPNLKVTKKVSNIAGTFAQTMLDINNGLLDTEDTLSKSNVYKRTLQRAMMANQEILEPEIERIMKKEGYKIAKNKNAYITNELFKLQPELMEEIESYARQEALESVFHQTNMLATKINALANSNLVEGDFIKNSRGLNAARFVINSQLPFTNTAINIGKTIWDYSGNPIRVSQTLFYNYKLLKEGKMTAAQYVNEIAKSSVGVSLQVVGMILANAGIIYHDDDDDEYKLNLGKYTIGLDWASPAIAPLVEGIEINNLLATFLDSESTGNQKWTSLTHLIRPWYEMGYVDNIVNIIENASYGKFEDMPTNITSTFINNYISSFLPQWGATINKVIDPTVRSTSVPKDSNNSIMDRFSNMFKYKTPGLSTELEPKLDEWGNEITRSENIIWRLIEQNFLPTDIEKSSTNKIQKELQVVAGETGSTAVLPKTPSSTFSYENVDYSMTPKEYTKFKETFGKNSYDLVNKVISSDFYENGTPGEKEAYLSDAYEYARYLAKKEYFDEKGIEYSPSAWTSSAYIASLYGVEPTDYIDFKTTIGEFKADVDKNGKTISGSKKQKVINYVSSMDISYNQKVLLLYSQGYSINNNNDRAKIANYVNNLNITKEEKIDILTKAKYKIVNGKVTW